MLFDFYDWSGLMHGIQVSMVCFDFFCGVDSWKNRQHRNSVALPTGGSKVVAIRLSDADTTTRYHKSISFFLYDPWAFFSWFYLLPFQLSKPRRQLEPTIPSSDACIGILYIIPFEWINFLTGCDIYATHTRMHRMDDSDFYCRRIDKW